MELVEGEIEGFPLTEERIMEIGREEGLTDEAIRRAFPWPPPADVVMTFMATKTTLRVAEAMVRLLLINEYEKHPEKRRTDA